jgi:hypothetical protein
VQFGEITSGVHLPIEPLDGDHRLSERFSEFGKRLAF